jgi:hypothetical protein
MDKIKTVQEIAQGVMYKSIRELVDEAIENRSLQVFKQERYILEQCGKLYRVKDCYARPTEYKTGWLKLGQAQGFLKLLRGNEQDDIREHQIKKA